MESSVATKSKSDTQGKQIEKCIINVVHQSYNIVGWIVSDCWWDYFISQNLLRIREYGSCSSVIVLELHQFGGLLWNLNDMRDYSLAQKQKTNYRIGIKKLPRNDFSRILSTCI